MRRTWKPDGYTSLAPYLIVDGAGRLVEFLVRAFGAAPLRRFEAESGGLVHVEVRVGDTVLMLADAAEGWPAFPVFLHLYVEDVDGVYGRALKAGGEAVQEPSRKEGDPDRRGGVKDPAGNTWWIATQVA